MADNFQKYTSAGEPQSGPSQDVSAALWDEARKGAGDDFVVTSIELDGQDVPDPRQQ